MKNGKISESVLKRSVLKQLHSKNPAVLQAGGPGVDAAVLGMDTSEKEDRLVTATATETLYSQNMAERCVLRAFHHIAACGARPAAAEVSLLVPAAWNEAQLRELMRDVDRACESAGAQVCGGHTAASRAVKTAVLTVTALGFADEESYIPSGRIRPGMELILAGYIAMEGTALLASEKREELSTRFAGPFLEKAASYGSFRQVLPAAKIAGMAQAAAMHALSEGGIFGALWEMAEASGIGMEVDLKKIPIRQETVEICEFFDLNPYKLLSGGALLIAAEDGAQVIRELTAAGIPAAIIGLATDSNDRVLLQQEERRFLESAQADEIYKVFEI